MSLGVNIKSYDLIKFGHNKLQYYDGLLIKADINLHSQLFDVVEAITRKSGKAKEQIRILDLACGEGAFAKRLVDNGYSIDCADIDEESFKFKNLCNFYRLDFNSQDFLQFAETNKENYDLIISMETIEHLENAWFFLRGLHTLCKKGGTVLVSTPNIENPPSKTFFIRTNQFQSFTIKSFNEIGHINPITEYEFRLIADQVSFKQVEVLGGGTHPIFWFTFDLKVCIPWTLSNVLFFPFSKKGDYSSCKIYIMEKD